MTEVSVVRVSFLTKYVLCELMDLNNTSFFLAIGAMKQGLDCQIRELVRR